LFWTGYFCPSDGIWLIVFRPSAILGIGAGLGGPDFRFALLITVFILEKNRQNEMRNQSVNLYRVVADGCANTQTVRRR
jgi:hypothetical protein